jgi:Nickel responsive protein SCO4226-like
VPTFMDVHEQLPDGAGYDDVAGAHAADVETQTAYGVNYKSYWVDETQGKVFCLIEAPNADAAHTVHREAHGLVADEIYPVVQGEDVP